MLMIYSALAVKRMPILWSEITR